MGSQNGGAISRPVRAMKPRSRVSMAALRVGRFTADLGVKQGLGHDFQGQRHHVGVNIADLTLRPGVQHSLGVSHHELGIAT